MVFFGGSGLSEAELWDLAFKLVDAHGQDAWQIVYRQSWAAQDGKDFVERAKWMDVSLCVIHLLRRKQGDC